MITPAQRQVLLDIGERFKGAGEDVNLSHLQDKVNETINITDQQSDEWKIWTAYMDNLNMAWLSRKEDDTMAWPEPPTDPANTERNDASQSAENLFQAAELCAAERLQRKLELEGGGKIGPARTQKSMSEKRKGGKPADTLINDLVIQREEPQEKNSLKMGHVVYCIGCDERRAGRDAMCIRGHAQNCSALQKEWLDLYKRVVEALQSRSLSEKLGDDAVKVQSEKEGKKEYKPGRSGSWYYSDVHESVTCHYSH
ncbi:hypothetical protein K435DRAFT_836742 [Dendrothele bispora CBS 962.96]|uniref:Uncharacterized protein n=1 Tax=Dendrothele bispora (strain CBS 962.96) TaxID=1314807 RepID=A0A4S8MI36_DENBC|nr:hypothetical protein K435DRAFT_836742 [Dendrothele bispora CBS 962.96]